MGTKVQSGSYDHPVNHGRSGYRREMVNRRSARRALIGRHTGAGLGAGGLVDLAASSMIGLVAMAWLSVVICIEPANAQAAPTSATIASTTTVSTATTAPASTTTSIDAPPAPPTSDLGSSLDSTWVAALSALAGAVVGSLLTILGEHLLHRREEGRAFHSLLRQVEAEVCANSKLAESRAAPGPFAFQPPLPTDAWHVFVASGLSHLLAGRGPLMARMNAFYGEVARANHLATQAVTALQIAQTTPDEGISRSFEAQAVALSRESFGPVVAVAVPLVEELREVLNG